MLDRDALAQLKGLKTQIEAEKERTEAVLRGTPARYGFARTDDGREVFVPPDEMLKAFPGDRVRVCIRPGKDKRPVADIEGLVESPIGEFTGRCVSKGKAMFVEPDIPGVSRWLFLPPQSRNGAKAGDYLRCALQRHPIRDGKPQAKVLSTIGAADDPGIENNYTMAKYGLQSEWSDSDKEQLEKVLGAMTPETDSHREDFSDLAFVTIDAARTQDIDDALYAEVTNDGWLLYVAIADPTAYIDADSPLRATVAERASSAYFHGAVVPMLPENIAQQRCALAENELRPALVCRVAIAEDGSVGEYRFFEATIRSRAKLSYFAVDRYLSGQDESLICHATPLEALYQVSRALRGRREAQELVMEDRQEFRWLLDDRGHIENIEPCEKLSSQRLVEECMVATNRCAAMFLAEAGAHGPFVVHDGFRRDRLKDRAKFLELYVSDAESLDPDSLVGYRDLLRQLASSDHELPLRSMVNRLLTRARLSKKPGAHMGMSLPLYTNCTSPLRKYLDFLVHLQIKATLRGDTITICEQPELDSLSQKLQKLRLISNEAERWLTLEYLQRQAKSTPGPWAAHVSHMGNNGFSVRLDNSGLEGYVDLRKAGEKFHFDKWTATLKSKTRHFRVNTPVNVTLIGSDEETVHLPLFKLDPNSGRKLEVVAKPSEATDN
ncbi:VacB/RNase II family 3'-5' exoribonuclease [Congregibacter sp.]|uniref:VacB/RNase II family 3'-5' exoribonuclease n=1 Tax=Congregibacter sp. TaxID=2744308 RepID=UPI00385D0EC5